MQPYDPQLLEVPQLLFVEEVPFGVRQPKKSSDWATGTPCSACVARSCRKPRKGARPVPQPIMIIGTWGLSGGRNGIVGLRTKAKTVLSGSLWARWLEHTPWKSPWPDRAGASSTPAVMLQTSGETSGEEEIE